MRVAKQKLFLVGKEVRPGQLINVFFRDMQLIFDGGNDLQAGANFLGVGR